MLNIIVPMAGRGSRFLNAGYEIPKPLINIGGEPMIKLVVDNLRPKREHRFIFIVQKQHIEQYGLKLKLQSYARNVEIVAIDGITEGQICTVLCAEQFFDNEEAVMCANSDQYVDIDINDYLDTMESHNYDGMIMTMHSKNPKWSYAKINEAGLVIETAEKKVISDQATVGIFNFKHGRDLVRSAKQMIADNIKVNGEFYTCPVYNYLVKEQKRIGIYSIGAEYDGMYGLGTPSDLEFFLKHDIKLKR